MAKTNKQNNVISMLSGFTGDVSSMPKFRQTGDKYKYNWIIVNWSPWSSISLFGYLGMTKDGMVSYVMVPRKTNFALAHSVLMLIQSDKKGKN